VVKIVIKAIENGPNLAIIDSETNRTVIEPTQKLVLKQKLPK
jgi:hypothetical protein